MTPLSQHCRKLKELKFAGTNTGVTISDMLTVAQFSQLEVLVVNEQPMFGDVTLRLVGRECPSLRTLSCVACHMVTDAGLSCLSTCQRLSDINFSYCPVTDQGLAAVLNSETRRVCIRACHGVTDDCIALMGRVCPRLETLDVCGCQLSLSDQCLLPLQDSLQSVSSRHHNFTLMAGGSSIGEEALEEFARVTGASVSLTDLSVPSLSADYVPDELDYFQFLSEDEEDWDHEATPPPAPERVSPLPRLEAPSVPVLYPHRAQDDYGENDHGDLDDFLIADDPAMFSDEFSGPEDWGFG
ncbi:F-box/LRR-repeat protein 7 [Geodia barretti]|uniref:F-box/LRR-repeat protein 7 n=1 Tax=Geodia barretti TaxID=519541 RepID=A0AA35TGK3_GEOBA|nr:F-box/LRR-repeat protein 7 [Geodia barretti]